jgi:hypothetical protein
VIILTTFVRLRLLTTPLERDEGEFAYAGQLMLHGIAPYKLLYNVKFPGIYAAYALIMAVFGQSPAGIHLGLWLVNLCAAGLLFLVARCFMDVPGAAVAAASYVIYSASPALLGLAGHATQFVMAAALAGLWLLLRAGRFGKCGLFFASGVMFGMACLMKQPGAVFGVFGFGQLACCAAMERGQWRVHARRIALYISGFVTPLILTALILWRAGVFAQFWLWTVVYAGAHAGAVPLSGGLQLLQVFFQKLPFAADGLLWLTAALGLVVLFSTAGERQRKWWMAAFFLVSLVAVCLGNYFFRHYFIMLLPALCLLSGWAVSVLAQRWPGPVWGLFILTIGLMLFHYSAIFFQLTPDEVCEALYPGNPFVECQQIGRRLGEHSPPEATIAVLGSEPEIYFYAHRHSATGYVYMYDLTSTQPYAEQMQRETVTQVQESRPEYVVFVGIPASWDVVPTFEHVAGSFVMTSMAKFIHDAYKPAGLCVVKPEPEYYWGKDSLAHRPTNAFYMSIYERR